MTSTVSQISIRQQELGDQVVAAVSELCKKIDEDRCLQSALTGLLGHFRQTTLESGSENNAVSAQNLEKSLVQCTKPRQFGRPLSEFRAHRHQILNICPNTCRCKCHRVHDLSLAGLLGIFGRSYAEIFGTSLVGSRCDNHSCRAPSAPRVRIIYILPRWVTMRIIFLKYSASFSNGIDYNLKVARVGRPGNDGFAAVLKDDLDRLKGAIASGECTPYDVQKTGPCSWSLLEASDQI